jgi:hypothetical protein
VKPLEVPRGRPGEETAPSDPTTTSVPTAADIADAYIVVLITPRDKILRKPYMSLHGAQQALRRARKRGQPAELVLCRLVPVAADLDIDEASE